MDNRLKEANFISAVVYMHNNEREITPFLEWLDGQLDFNFKKYEIICVDDGSGDGSADAVRNYGKTKAKEAVSLLHMSYFQGLETAMNAGVDLAIGDFVFEFDTVCMDYPTELFMQVYRRSLEGYDIVSASAVRKNKWSSDMFYRVFNHFSRTQYKIRNETFRILSRRAINRVHSLSKTIPYRKVLYANCGLLVDCIAYTPQKTSVRSFTDEQAKMRRTLAVDSLVLFTNIGYKVAVTMTGFMMFATVAAAVYAVAVFALGNPIPGWTTTILFLAVSFFGLFSILTIIIKYLSLILQLVFNKQKYSFSSIEKITK